MKSISKSAAILAAGASFLALNNAEALLSFDLRAVQVNGLPAPDPKAVSVQPLDTVVFELYAKVSGPTEAAALEGFQIGIGSFLSSGDGRANVTAREFVSPFNGAGAQLGTIVDLDLDGDLDLGDNATTVSNTNHVAVRSAAVTTGNPTGLGISEFAVFRLTISAVGPGNVGMNFRKTDFTGLTTEFSWQENGVFTTSRNVNGGTVAGVLIEAPVQVTVIPEPSVAVTLLGGVATLLGLRRRKH